MRILAADIGFGTTDILVYDSSLPIENCPKLVVPSGTQKVAARFREATGAGRAIFFDGVTMGGGPCGKALREHLEAGLSFFATPSAALTFNDDINKVSSWGVTIIDDASAVPAAAIPVRSGDLDMESIRAALGSLGIDPVFDGAAIAVQDHGFAPGSSNRRNRFSLWRRLLAEDPSLDSLAFEPGAIPEPFTRMRAAASLVSDCGRIIAMDTGPAAIRGAISLSLEDVIREARLVANCGNGHTLAALVSDGEVLGIVEHHTGSLDAAAFSLMLRNFLAGTLTDDDIFAAGGHGCLPPAEPFVMDTLEPVIVTGPRRDEFRGSDLAMEFAAPFGDMMLTGCFGLVGTWLRLA